MPGAPPSRLLPSARTQRGTAAPGPCLTANASAVSHARLRPRAPGSREGLHRLSLLLQDSRTAAAAASSPERDRVPLRLHLRLPALEPLHRGRWRWASA